MAKIELNNEQLRLIQTALDFYSRMGILQFERLLEHPSIDNLIDSRFTPKKKLEVGDRTVRGEIVEIGKKYIKTKGSWGNTQEIKTWTDIDKIKLSPDWSQIHKTQDEIKFHLERIKDLIYSEIKLGHGSLGIHNPNVDNSCRDAFDIIQIIRHEFWKKDPNHSSITVDSSVSLIGSEPVIVELDNLKDIRKRKLKKIKK